MKKIFTFLIVFSGIMVSTSAQILNPGFEQWNMGNPDNWFTSNLAPGNLIPVTQTADAHSGNYAVKGDVINLVNVPYAPIIQSGTNATGFPVSVQYLSFDVWYKFAPLGGDRFAVNIALTKNGETIAQGAVALPEPVTQYTRLTVPLTYTVNETPDIALIQISIVGPITGNDLHVGSVMYVDDVALSTSTGMEDTGDGLVSCYPNPAFAFVNIPVRNVSGGIMISVFDSRGKEVYSTTTDPEQRLVRIPVTNMAPGLYYYSVKESNKLLRGKFSVSR